MAKIEAADPPTTRNGDYVYRYDGHEITLERGHPGPTSTEARFRVLVDGQPVPMTLVRVRSGYRNSLPHAYRNLTEPEPVGWVELPNKLGWSTLGHLAARPDAVAPQLGGTLSAGHGESYNTVVHWSDTLDITFIDDLSRVEVVVDCYVDDAT